MKKKLSILVIICVTMFKSITSNAFEQTEKYLKQMHEKVIYLTFDDGPSPHTNKVLNVLNEEGVKATFFVIGNQVETHKNIIKNLQKSGMCILPHTDTHNYRKIYKSSEDYFNDLNSCKDKIKNITLEDSINFVRFPGGVRNELLKKDVLNDIREKFLEDKYYFVEWNVYGLDAERVPKDSYTILNSTINQLRSTPKAIVLLHDGYGNANTANCLKEIIVKAKSLGFKFKTLEEITEKDIDYFIKKSVINKKD